MPNDKVKILMFLQAGVGGAERMTVLFGKTLPQSKFEVIFYPVVKGNLGKNNIVDFIPSECSVNMLHAKSSIHLCRAIVKTIAAEKPDYVFSSVLYLNDKILLFREWFPQTRFVIRCENYWYTFSANQQRLMRLLYGRADMILAQTKEMKDEFAAYTRIPSSKIKVLENPIDKDSIDALMCDSVNPYPDDGTKKYVAVGRFSHQKGFDLLVEAFAILLKKQGVANLYIVGTYEGSSRKTYEAVRELVKEYSIEDKVHFVGYQSNPYPYIRYADAFVLSSRWEGLPNVMLEAMYLGTPVAAFKCIPFVERTIRPGQNGYCADREDVQALAKAIYDAGQMGRCVSEYIGTTPEEISDIFTI